MAQYDEDFPVGSKVRVADASVLEHYLRPNWVYDHPLDPANIRLAGSVQVVASVAFYHGGDVLYELEGVPGQWHEACLRGDDEGSRKRALNPTHRFRSLLSQGESRDAALGEMRRAGASPIQCIKAIHDVEGVDLGTAKRLFSESRSWRDIVENTEAMFVEAEKELHAILRIGHETSIRGAGLSLRDALSQTRYREIRPALVESLLVTYLKDDPTLIEEWLLYSEDKRTDGGWYLLRDGTIGQVRRRGDEIRFPSLEQAVAAYIVRELDFWANLSHGS